MHLPVRCADFLWSALNFDQPIDTISRDARFATAKRHRLEIEQKLAYYSEKLTPYEKVKSQKRFYDEASAAIYEIRQRAYDIGEMQVDVQLFVPIAVDLYALSEATRLFELYIDARNVDEVARAT